MKRLVRPAPPPVLTETHAQDSEVVPLVKHWYDTLRDKDDTIRDRWNLRRAGKQPIRETLSALGNHCCAWCGKKLDALWTVDHYLPKEEFPRLSYYWHNLLPACSTCNTRYKGNYVPPTLARDSVVDPILKLSIDQTCNFSTLLTSHPTRLVHPSEEDPCTHLAFDPLQMRYTAHTTAGRETNQKFFGGGADKDFSERMNSLSQKVAHELQHPAPNIGIQLLKDLIGQEFYIDAFVTFWQSFNPPTTQPVAEITSQPVPPDTDFALPPAPHG